MKHYTSNWQCKCRTVAVFDLDDTLYDEEQFVQGGFRTVAEFVANRFSFETESVFDFLQKSLEISGRGKTFDDLVLRYNLPKEMVPQLVSIYRNHSPVLTIYPDAKNLIESLYGKSYLALITDGDRKVQWSKIRALGIEEYFDLIVVTDDYGKDKSKPSPFPYEKIMQDLANVRQDLSFVYIGDNVRKDFVTARKLGWFTIRILRNKGMFMHFSPEAGYDAHVTVKDLKEVFDYIDISSRGS